MYYPRLSIVLPVRNEEAFISNIVQQLLDQDYPPEKFEILIADGRSTDRTREIVRELAGCHRNIRLLDNPRLLSSGARNVGAREATGDIVVYVDGHCVLPDNQFLKNVALAFHKSGADCLGRAQPLIPSDRPTAQAIALARSSFLGHKPDSFIYSDFEGFIDPTSCGAAYRKDVFQKIGFFDETFDACEDVEFNWRARDAGLTCYLAPTLRVLYFPRQSLRALFRQTFRYGWGRFELFQKHSRSLSLFMPMPGLFLFFLLMLLLGGMLQPFLFQLLMLAIFAYALPVVLFSCYLSLRKKLSLFPILLLVFPTIHFGLSLGFWASGWSKATQFGRRRMTARAGIIT